MSRRDHEAAPPGLALPKHLLDDVDRVEFERLLQWLRLSFLVSPLLVLTAFGVPALPYALLISAAVIASYLWVWTLLRTERLLLRWQLQLRFVDCALVVVVLTGYHGFLHDAYYDVVYTLFVVAAAATHGRRGALLLSLFAGALVLASRLYLLATGQIVFHSRHLTDSVFFAVLYLVIGVAVAFLMHRSGEAAMRRDRAWEMHLTQRNHDLERIAAARDKALAEAEAAIRTRDDLLGLVSHDLKSPLTVIIGVAELLQRQATRAGGLTPEQGARGLKRIQDAAWRMGHLIGELLDIARLRAGHALDLDLRPTDLVVVLQRVVGAHQASSGGERLTLTIPQTPLIGEWDASRLERVFDNLISNALKYSPPDADVAVTVRRSEPDLAAAPHGRAEVSVHDRGIGIPTADLSRIFERFYRAPNVAGGAGGTGLGLASARQIVEQHGGSIDVESTESEGSTFTVTLPLAPAPSRSSPADAAGSEPVGAATAPAATDPSSLARAAQ